MRFGRPRIYSSIEERLEYHKQKLKDCKYSTEYYHNNKERVECKYCGKEINNLAKGSHYKSKFCMASRNGE